ncbi:putative C2H2 finger domain protein [Talaromyces proteolyticus]|uniref:C2H2 finger domain protein n=1 Tax=Talaromyces proteolyticus TaxID=1131652 RepID=A0AAD4KMM6_9EURO|nr:putative C2H2 finger domain protein [Talaromyces proteolyticus]KAH8694974.1 putative C2H2 finger domain protein [Talaromyces proteolyticus]
MESGNAVSLTSLQTMNHKSRHNHTSLQDLSSITRNPQDDETSQDHFILSSALHHTQDMDQWTLSTSDSMESSPIATQPETPEVQMLSYSFSHQLIPSGAGINDTAAMFPSLSDVQVAGNMGDHGDMDFSHTQDFTQAFSSLVDFPYDHDEGCTRDDTASPGHASHHDDCHLVSTQDTWSLPLDTSNYGGAAFDQITNALSAPVSPPLTESSHISVTSACSQPAYPFRNQDETLMGDATVCGQNISLGEPFLPLTPPLNEQDPNRTIRPSKQAQRHLLSTTTTRPARKSDPEAYVSLPIGEPARRTKEDSESRATPRDHPFYSLPTRNDGKYYCPFASGENPCTHTPTTQKCAYHKYLDSHLKPYRCKVPACAAQNLHFSSNACLFRHEREAHGFHGHGDNPHLCLFEGCDRAVPGYGFPRRWNLFDHMKRVHDYTASDQPSSPETATAAGSGQISRKKDSAGIRKRKVTKPVGGATTMKRTKSTSSQGNAGVKANSAQHSQRLQNAEHNYYNCRSRLLEELATIKPQDSTMHEKVNASLQELITLGLNYRQLEASSAATQLANGICS